MDEVGKEDKEDALHEARERYARCTEAWQDDRDRYKEDVRFAAGYQWHQKDWTAREKDGRPALVVDKIQQYIRQVVNDSRQNRPSIKVRPIDSDADVETADILQGLCRHIEERSSADVAYDTSIECAAKGGFGFMRVITEYAHDSTFEQELCIKRVRNPLTVSIDPDIQEVDGSDMGYGFVIEQFDKDTYETTWPNADPVNFDVDSASHPAWYGEEKITVAEYFYIEETPQNLSLFVDGTTGTDEEIAAAKEAGITIPEIKETRVIPIKKVMWAKISGKEFLEEPMEWPSKYIPIVPVWGNEEDIDGEVRHTGMVRNAKDACRLYNYSRSAYAERVALTPKAPYVAAFGQVEQYPEWEDANNVNYSVLRYDPIDVNGTVLGAPQRQQPFDVPASFSADMKISEHDIQASLGMYAASLGRQGNATSGRQEVAQQREGDTATFHYHDNLARAIRHVGRIIVDMAPRIYDTARIVRILGVDGEPSMIQLNPNQPQSTLKINGQTIHNIGMGKYDVSVSTGPSYNTRRQEATESMMNLVQGNPQLMGVIGDLVVKGMDWHGADEIADRLRLMLPPQIQQSENKDQKQSPEVQQVMAQAQQAISQRDQSLQQAQQMMQQMQQKLQELMQEQSSKAEELRLKGQELQVKDRDSDIKAYDAETKRMQVLQPAFDQNQIKEIVMQTMHDLMANDMANDTPQVPDYQGA